MSVLNNKGLQVVKFDLIQPLITNRLNEVNKTSGLRLILQKKIRFIIVLPV